MGRTKPGGKPFAGARSSLAAIRGADGSAAKQIVNVTLPRLPPAALLNLVRPLRAFHHSTNIFIREAQLHGGLLKLAAKGSGIGLIDELEVGEDLPGCVPFEFL